MSIELLQKVTATTVSAAAGVAIVGAIGWNQQAQAASFTYSSIFSVAQVTQVGNVPLANANFSFLKQDLPAPAANGGTVGYELLSFAATILGQSYNLTSLLTSPTLQSQAALVNSYLPTQYQGILPRVLAQNPNGFDYIGDGDFPPANFSETFTYANRSYLVSLVSTFENNGSSGGTTSEAVPEPTTILGLGLAGAGLAAARRRKQQA
ncbi:PEP-CTERM sorting domain-containing protein [Pantanalinema sp. GBBB05]|uniref:PEP-CTERM sorting domain-containing protein n=1 Tax=Pantanalinema sp. GBBB05 TaxID=2604139 RepID=UPI003D81C2FB